VTGRSPARLLAPLALAIAAVALFAVVTSGGSGGGSASSDTPTATATAKPSAARKKTAAKAKKAKATTYTIKPGDTPSSIAQSTGVDLDALLSANPNANPSALTVGEKLKLP
jgi:LysM repeat protein